eukprot:scaffold3969_cov363-Prasinococcus_capsulatus_cf.AAC.1
MPAPNQPTSVRTSPEDARASWGASLEELACVLLLPQERPQALQTPPTDPTTKPTHVSPSSVEQSLPLPSLTPSLSFGGSVSPPGFDDLSNVFRSSQELPPSQDGHLERCLLGTRLSEGELDADHLFQPKETPEIDQLEDLDEGILGALGECEALAVAPSAKPTGGVSLKWDAFFGWTSVGTAARAEPTSFLEAKARRQEEAVGASTSQPDSHGNDIVLHSDLAVLNSSLVALPAGLSTPKHPRHRTSPLILNHSKKSAPIPSVEWKGCGCKHSGCLKLYCPCFRQGIMCQGCKCDDDKCKNNSRHLDALDVARSKAFSRLGSRAFMPKVRMSILLAH